MLKIEKMENNEANTQAVIIEPPIRDWNFLRFRWNTFSRRGKRLPTEKVTHWNNSFLDLLFCHVLWRFFFFSFLYLYLRQQQWKSELFLIVFKIRALHYNAEINVMPHRFVFEVNCSEVPSSLLRLYRNKAFSFRINFFMWCPFPLINLNSPTSIFLDPQLNRLCTNPTWAF